MCVCERERERREREREERERESESECPMGHSASRAMGWSPRPTDPAAFRGCTGFRVIQCKGFRAIAWGD